MTNIQNGTHSNPLLEVDFYGSHAKNVRAINEYGFILHSKIRALALNDFLHIQQDNELKDEFAGNQRNIAGEIYRWLYMSLV